MQARRLLPALASAAVLVASACGSDSSVSSVKAESRGSASTEGTVAPTDGSSPSSSDETTATSSETGSTTATSSDGTTAMPELPPATIDWEPVEGWDDIEQGRLEVPIDYQNPDAGSFQLYVVRNPANDPDKRIGSLLVNPGGPGFPGSPWALNAEANYGEDLLDHFDIIGWDPRGTGDSDPYIDCVDDYDRYFGAPDVTPDDDTEHQQLVDLAKEFEDACAEKNAAILQFVGTNSSARDMDRLRQALGEETISYFGFSYGSELGATWATLFPDTVRAAVFDGAADPTADLHEKAAQQFAGFESVLTTFLAQCSADSSCAFHSDGNAEAAYDALMVDLDANPIPTEPGRPDANRAIGLYASLQAMYSTSYWESFEEALASAQDGDGSGLLYLFDEYYVRTPEGSWGNELEAFQSIDCMDSAERPTVEEDDAFAAELSAIAPRLVPAGLAGSYQCTFFPPSLDPRLDITGAGAGELLVVGTTGDPATPLASARVMADTLEDGVLLVVEGDEHTGYGVNDCSRETIESYLVDLEVPADESEC